ncbi:MAG: ABC transporter substrate-binding protein [Dehalococcoidia bacterium]|nr:MAG: ABC transporter substrate-binding protein [Dehalococcoidia bacterium]
MRNLGRFWLTFLALAALLLVLAVACEEEEEGITTGTPAVTPTPVVIGDPDIQMILGTHFAQSGTYGAAFAPVLAGLKAYFNYVNAEEGGVCGRRIFLKVEDDGYDPARAVEVVRKLVEEDQVYAIVAGLGTDAHSAVWEDLNAIGVPDLWIMSGAHKFGSEPEKYPWSVPLLPDYYVEGTIFGKYISENLPGKKVGVLYQDDDFGRDELAGLKNGLDPTKNEIVSEQSYESTALDIRPQVTSLKDDGVEVVVGACFPGHCHQAIKEADRLDWHPLFFISYGIADYVSFMYPELDIRLMEGVITTQVKKLSSWTDDPAVAEHHRIMKEYGDSPPSNLGIIGQLAASLTVEALRATCDNLTREGLMDAVHSFQDYQSDLMLPGITISLSPTDHLTFEAMRMMRAMVVDGKGKWEYFGHVISFAEED